MEQLADSFYCLIYLRQSEILISVKSFVRLNFFFFIQSVAVRSKIVSTIHSKMRWNIEKNLVAKGKQWNR